MPGLSLIFSSGINREQLESAFVDLETDGVSRGKLLYCDECFALLFSGHEGYPYRYIENEEHVVLLEGMVYNRSSDELTRTILELAHGFPGSGETAGRVRDFVSGCDGDFMGVIYSKRTPALIVFNDYNGRLHSFYHRSPERFALSRELKFILRFIPEIAVDRFGLAQCLMFEYTLGDTTMFRDIRRLLPSHMAQVKCGSPGGKLDITVGESSTVLFDERGAAPSKAECIERLAALYMESIENRYATCRDQGYSCIADVSGGFDTRTVMLGLEKIGADVGYFTHDLVSGDESSVALELGRVYGKPVTIVRASHAIDYNDIERLAYATDCMVNGWTALTSWQDSSVKRRMLDGKVASFMGFGGEFIRHPFLPARGFHTLSALFRANVLKAPLQADWASFLAGLSAEDFAGRLESYFESFPEQTLAGKLKRLYFQYYSILVTAGEDRTRRFFWTVQPLWGKELYAYEMHEVPLDYARYSFFRELMRRLDPKALDVPIYRGNLRLGSDFNLALYEKKASMRYHIRNSVLSSRLFNSLYFRFRSRELHTDAAGAVAEKLFAVHREMEGFKGCIQRSSIEEFIGRGYGLSNLHRLLTVLLYFRQIEKRFGQKII